MNNPQIFKPKKDEEEHLNVLRDAREVLKQARQHRETGRERLENALKKYKERSG